MFYAFYSNVSRVCPQPIKSKHPTPSLTVDIVNISHRQSQIHRIHTPEMFQQISHDFVNLNISGHGSSAFSIIINPEISSLRYLSFQSHEIFVVYLTGVYHSVLTAPSKLSARFTAYSVFQPHLVLLPEQMWLKCGIHG